MSAASRHSATSGNTTGGDWQVRDGVIEIRPIRSNPRDGWAEDARRLTEQGDDAPLWPEFANEGDSELVW